MPGLLVDVSALYTTHLSRVYAFFAYRVANRSDAEDLASATFERAVKHARRYDARRASETTWLFAIAENVLIDHYRRTGRRQEQQLPDDADEPLAAPEDRPLLGVAPELERALAGLSERERQVVGLRFGADLSGKEIAAVVGATEANVHQLLSRSMRRMRGVMGDDR